MTFNPSDVRNLLSAENLSALRQAYKSATADQMNKAATTATAAVYEESKEFVASIGNRFYMQAGAPGHLTARDRQRVVISVLATGNSAPFTLAIHFYWGLMEELEIWEIAETLLLVGAYTGISSFAHTASVLQDTLRLLDTLPAQGESEITPMKILGTLIAAFRSKVS